MADYDFETRMSDSVLKDRLPDFDPEQAVLLNAPGTIDTILRLFAKQITDWNGEYLKGAIPADVFEARTKAEARRLQDILYGGSPDTYWPTPWHTPGQLGRHILTFGPLADTPEDAVYGLLGRFASALLQIVNNMAGQPEEQWKASIDSLFENYQGVLMGYMGLE